MSGVTPGHGDFSISAINMPVSVAGMAVAPGEIIHMDENGACKFPVDRLADVYKNVKELAQNSLTFICNIDNASPTSIIRTKINWERRQINGKAIQSSKDKWTE